MTDEPEDRFQKSIRSTVAMYRLTRNHIVNTYWRFRRELQETGFAPFVIRGSLRWESEGMGRITDASGSVWLMSYYFNPEGRHIAEDPIRLHMQWDLSLYEIWGGIALPEVPEDETQGREILREVVERASLVAGLTSLITRASLAWLPARYLNTQIVAATPPPPQEERTEWRCVPLARGEEDSMFAVVDDEFVGAKLLPLYEHLGNLKNSGLKGVLGRAVSWHAFGNNRGMALNRFVNYWASVELLAEYFFERLKLGEARSERKDRVLSVLSDLTAKDCFEKVLQASEIVRPTARTKIQAVIPVLTEGELDETLLFRRREQDGMTLAEIRNDIAHGNHADHELEFTDIAEARLQEIQEYSRKVLIGAIVRAEKLAERLESPDGA